MAWTAVARAIATSRHMPDRADFARRRDPAGCMQDTRELCREELVGRDGLTELCKIMSWDKL